MKEKKIPAGVPLKSKKKWTISSYICNNAVCSVKILFGVNIINKHFTGLNIST